MNGQTIRTITIRGTSEGLDKLTADLHKLAAAEQGVAVVSDDLTKRQISLAAQWKRSTLALDENARAQDKMASQTRLAAAAVRQGQATQEQADQHLARVAERYGLVGKAAGDTATHVGNLTKQSSRNAAEMLNLGRQFSDVAVSLQAGQSIFVIGLQQGSQIIDVIASSNRSMSQIASQAMGWAKGLVTSIGGVVTAVGAAAAAVGYLVYSYASAQKEIEKVLTSGPGAASGLSRGGLNQIAQGAVGSGMNVNEARAAALEFAKTGQIYEQNIKSATEATRLFVQAAGGDAADASKQLAAALVDPAKGAQDLNKQFGFLDATLLNHIRTLQSQGKLQEAQAALLAGLTPTLQKQAGTVDFLTAQWRKYDQAVIDFNKSIDKALGLNKDLTTQLDEAMKKLQAAQDAAAKGGDLGVGPRGMKALQDAATAAEAEVRRLEKAMADLKAQTEAQRLKNLSNIADAFTRALIPSIAQVERLTTALSDLEKAKASGVGGPNADAALTIGRAQLLTAKETLGVEERKAARLLQYGSTHDQILARMKDQLAVAGAVGVSAQIQAQHQATINQLLDHGLTLTQAIAQADAQRAIALAQIASAHQTTMVALQGELEVAQAITGQAQMAAQYEATIRNLKQQGLSNSQAAAQAGMQQEIAQARVNTSAEQTLKNLKNEMELIKATTEEEKDRIKARQTLNKLIEDGVDKTLAEKVAVQQLKNATEQRDNTERDAADAAFEAARRRAIAYQDAEQAARNEAVALRNIESAALDAAYAVGAFIPFLIGATAPSILHYEEGKNIFKSTQGGYTQFKPGGYESTGANVGYQAVIDANKQNEAFFANMDQRLMEQFTSQFNKAIGDTGGNIGAAVTSMLGTQGLFTGRASDAGKVSALSSAIDLLPKDQQIGAYQGMFQQLQASPLTLETAPLVKQLGDKIADLTRATDDNTSATTAQTDVLSPFYSSDPRATHLGFRAFAGGGIMTQYGELPLRQYQSGGIVTTPQVAVFGEGSTPEAYVPAPGGRIPVNIKMPANSNQRPINVTINVMGNADAGTVAALKQTSFQKTQQLRRMTG